MVKRSFLLLLILPFTVISWSFKQQPEKKSTNKRLNSDDFDTPQGRIKKLKKHVPIYSEIIDAEFDLYDVNGNFNNESNWVPTRTQKNYLFVVKVATDSVYKWIKGMHLTQDNVVLDSFPRFTRLHDKLDQKIPPAELGKFYVRKVNENYALVFAKSGLVFRNVVKF